MRRAWEDLCVGGGGGKGMPKGAIQDGLATEVDQQWDCHSAGNIGRVRNCCLKIFCYAAEGKKIQTGIYRADYNYKSPLNIPTLFLVSFSSTGNIVSVDSETLLLGNDF